MRLLFEQANPFACLGQRHTRRQARETATDDEDVVGHCLLLIVNENRNSKFETRRDSRGSDSGPRTFIYATPLRDKP